MTTPHLPRFESVQRRAFLKRLAALGAAGLVPGLACGNNDAEVFGRASSTTRATTAAPTTDASSTTAPAIAGPSTAAATTSPPTTTAPSTAGPATTTHPAGAALPAGAKLDVAFTYTADGAGFGPVRNPYIAVWLETPTGELVRNISVWYQSGRGERYLGHLSNWYTADQNYYDAHGNLDFQSVSGATRPAGTYTVTWDGNDESGTPAVAGQYVVFVESAREHGSLSLTSAPITVGPKSATVKLPDNGELHAATATYTA